MPSLGTGSRLPIYGQPDAPGGAGCDGRRPWRSLEELEARALPSPEFAPGAAEAPDGLSRRSFLQLLGAAPPRAPVGGRALRRGGLAKDRELRTGTYR